MSNANLKHGNSLDDLAEILKIGKRLKVYAEDACNFGLSDRREVNRSKLEARARAIANELCIGIRISRDPRAQIIQWVRVADGDTV